MVRQRNQTVKVPEQATAVPDVLEAPGDVTQELVLGVRRNLLERAGREPTPELMEMPTRQIIREVLGATGEREEEVLVGIYREAGVGNPRGAGPFMEVNPDTVLANADYCRRNGIDYSTHPIMLVRRNIPERHETLTRLGLDKFPVQLWTDSVPVILGRFGLMNQDTVGLLNAMQSGDVPDELRITPEDRGALEMLLGLLGDKPARIDTVVRASGLGKEHVIGLGESVVRALASPDFSETSAGRKFGEYRSGSRTRTVRVRRVAKEKPVVEAARVEAVEEPPETAVDEAEREVPVGVEAQVAAVGARIVEEPAEEEPFEVPTKTAADYWRPEAVGALRAVNRGRALPDSKAVPEGLEKRVVEGARKLGSERSDRGNRYYLAADGKLVMTYSELMEIGGRAIRGDRDRRLTRRLGEIVDFYDNGEVEFLGMSEADSRRVIKSMWNLVVDANERKDKGVSPEGFVGLTIEFSQATPERMRAAGSMEYRNALYTRIANHPLDLLRARAQEVSSRLGENEFGFLASLLGAGEHRQTELDVLSRVLEKTREVGPDELRAGLLKTLGRREFSDLMAMDEVRGVVKGLGLELD